MARRWAIQLGFALAFPTAAAADSYVDRYGDLRIDEVQYIATHNSYHIAPDWGVRMLLERSGYQSEEFWNGPRLARALNYTHLPLTTQLDLGIRAVELDIHDDPVGGRFDQPGFLKALRAAGLAPEAPYDPARTLTKPGFKVFHQTDYDQRSTCLRLSDCLAEISSWSSKHPGHAPIFIFLETKQGSSKPLTRDYSAAPKATFSTASWLRLHDEIMTAFKRSQILTPDDVRGTETTVAEAVRRRGWPTLRQSSGKVAFMLLDSETTAASYNAAIGAERASLLFTAERPDATVKVRNQGAEGWITLPDPKDGRIAVAAGVGMLTFTRADADTEEARHSTADRRDRAFAVGASFVSTDYPYPNRLFSDYAVRFADGPFVRCNPVRAARCQAADTQSTSSK